LSTAQLTTAPFFVGFSFDAMDKISQGLRQLGWISWLNNRRDEWIEAFCGTNS